MTSKLVRMVASICSVTSPPRLRGSMISRRAAAPLRSLMRGELGDLGGKPEGLAFTAQGRAIVGLDTRKPRRNLLLLEPAVAELPGRGR